MADARKYSDEDVREILESALKNSPGDASALTHADLLAIGEQVGVTPEAMARAADEITRAKLDNTASRSIKSQRRKWLALHAAIFAIVNGLLFTVNFLTTPGEWWFLFSVFFWGLALAAHAGAALGLAISPRALERERRKLQAKQALPSPKLRVGAAEPAAPSVESRETDATEKEPSRAASRS
jgi:hypothetical protein